MKTMYSFYTASEIKPTSFMKKQLLIQANGLSGNLDKVWRDVSRSKWIGYECDGWERVPYWLDGFIPLAYLLEDKDLIARAEKYINAIIASQKSDGWICPCDDDKRAEYDMWAAILISKVLTVYAQCSGKHEVDAVIEKTLFNLYEHIEKYPLFGWGKYRWYEGIVSIYYLHEKDPKPWHVKLAELLFEQGKDFNEIFSDESIKTYYDHWTWDHHVVNIAMALKSEAMYYLITGKGSPSSLAHKMIDTLDKYHSTAVGHFTGDECLSGDSPIQGTELCGIVEAMYSYEWLYAVTGETYWLDRLEKLAYNALPAQNSPDMWTHQYVQMVNQVSCIRMWGKPIFNSNNGEAHIFGLEPHFGCCTANFSQGFPKFVLSSFYHSGRDIVSASLCPSKLKTKIDGVSVEIELVTDYPFRNELKYIVKTDKPIKFRLLVRVPQFAKADYGKDYIIFDEVWQNTSERTVVFTPKPVFVSRGNSAVCLEYGALVFTLAIDEKWVMHEYTQKGVERRFPYCDYEIYPQSDWNFAFANNNTDNLVVKENPMPEYTFSPDKPALEIYADMVKIDWGVEDNWHDVCRKEPLSRKALTNPQKMRLIPYGCSNLRLTENVFAE